ncbi:MAG: endo-1,4-beta-xylanase [Aggregatilineales bacterium]
MRRFYTALLVILLLLSLAASGTQAQAGKSDTLRSLAQARGFYIGAAAAIPPLRANAQYGATLSREFNLVVPENVMKMGPLRPTRDTFDFSDADTLVAFAEANGMKVRGHNLVWHQQLPAWLTQGQFSRAELLDILHQHIATVVGHYKGRILAWDVVNEAVGDNGQMRSDLWSQGIGPEYIDDAFRWAHEADPNAKLFYNDYNGEGSGRKSDMIYALVKDLKARGVPIDGVGLQMHVGIDHPPNPTAVRANIARLGALGLQVQITEMDVKIQNGVGTPSERLVAQAEVYRQMLSVCLETPVCTAFLTWGFTDQYSWIPGFTGHPDAPLPFDTNYAPKPAYWALRGVLNHYHGYF